MTQPRPSHVFAISLGIAGFALFSLNDGMIKAMSAHYPLPQMIFFNAVFAMMAVLVFAALSGGMAGLVTKRPLVHLVRGLFGMGVALGAFFAFSRMPMAEVYAILFAAPLITAGVSAIWFGERLDRAQWLAVVIGFVGVLEMLHPSGDAFNEGAFAAFFGALCFAGSGLIVRHWGRDERPASFPFYGCCVGGTLDGLMTPLVWVPPSWHDVAIQAAGGLAAGVGLLCILNAFRLAPPPVIAPYQYTQMIWGVLLGALLFGDVPQWDVLPGAVAVVGSGWFLYVRERRRGQAPPVPAAVQSACPAGNDT